MTRPAKPLHTPATMENMEAVQAYVRQQSAILGVPEALHLKLDLVVEEIYVNIVNHARTDGTPEATIECAITEQQFCVTLRDNGAPFNPLERETPSLDADIDERPIGGLGIHLVTQMADNCTYAREKDKNVFTACFTFEG